MKLLKNHIGIDGVQFSNHSIERWQERFEGLSVGQMVDSYHRASAKVAKRYMGRKIRMYTQRGDRLIVDEVCRAGFIVDREKNSVITVVRVWYSTSEQRSKPLRKNYG